MLLSLTCTEPRIFCKSIKQTVLRDQKLSKMALAGTSRPSMHQVKLVYTVVQTRIEVWKPMHIKILEYQQLWKEKSKSENHQNTNECVHNQMHQSCTDVGAHFQSQIFLHFISMCVYSSTLATSNPPPRSYL